MERAAKRSTVEWETVAWSGWLMLLVNLGLLFGAAAWLANTISEAEAARSAPIVWKVVAALFAEVAAVVMFFGYFTLQPNEARVLILLGAYRGTVRSSGFFWANPLYARVRARVPFQQAMKAASRGQPPPPPATISLRAHNFTSERLKVNDKRGNPIEIAAVVVWRIEDTARAVFDVEDYEHYVQIQSEAALRHVASMYAYDRVDDHEPTLRESGDEVAAGLRERMAGGAELRVPLKVDVGRGANWDEAH